MSSRILKLRISLLEIETIKDDDGKQIEVGTLRTWEKTHTFLERIVWTPDAFKKIARILLYDVFSQMHKELIKEIAPRPAFVRKQKPKLKLKPFRSSHCTKCGLLFTTFNCTLRLCRYQKRTYREI